MSIIEGFHFTFIFIGLSGVWPYSTLQARSIGLSFNDISIVLGIMPLAAALANPIMGRYSCLS